MSANPGGFDGLPKQLGGAFDFAAPDMDHGQFEGAGAPGCRDGVLPDPDLTAVHPVPRDGQRAEGDTSRNCRSRHVRAAAAGQQTPRRPPRCAGDENHHRGQGQVHLAFGRNLADNRHHARGRGQNGEEPDADETEPVPSPNQPQRPARHDQHRRRKPQRG